MDMVSSKISLRYEKNEYFDQWERKWCQAASAQMYCMHQDSAEIQQLESGQ